MAERGYSNLNKSVLKQISRALEDDPAADIGVVLNKISSTYADMRRVVGARRTKHRKDCCEKTEPPPPKKQRLAGALLPFASLLQSQLSQPGTFLSRTPPLVSISCTLPYSVVHPLSPLVYDILGISAEPPSDLSSRIVGQVLSGKPIWEGTSRAVFQVSETVVVKAARSLDPDEHDVLQFLADHVPSVPAPRALGLVRVGTTFFMFMTLIPGTTLENRWPLLSKEAKAHIQRVLDDHFLALRQLELPNGTPFGSPAGRRLCKDVRRDERVSTSPIYTEAAFNDFLLSSPSSRASQAHKDWLRSMLRVDHRIVCTHADFHPRNVMVIDGPDGGVELSGIIDWECSGYYPEYWEHLKAMNTRSIKDTSDWWDCLPSCILGYDRDLVLDRVIESTVVY